MTRKTLVLVAVVLMAVPVGAAEMPTGEEYTNSVGMRFVRIKPGSFTMGVGKTPLPHELTHHRGTQFEGDFDERPNHQVTMTRPFYMGIVEVTNFQYELFDPSHKDVRGKDANLSEDDDEAVINVNWYDAMRFCQWLSDKDGMPYRLPTEAEWEYACRAGTTTHFHVGDALSKEFLKNASMLGVAKDVPLHVGKTTPNPWGLFDMHGNVEEWCHDWYGPYVEGPQKDPVGYIDGDFRVLRGGSHGTDPYYLRSANRLGTVPEDKHWLIGFRVVIGAMPDTEPMAVPEPPLNQQNVVRRKPSGVKKGPDPEKPYFKGPRQYVRIPKEANGPIFAGHNHCPAIVECPNGDLLAIWYTGIGERERNMAVCASRLVRGTDQWQPASTFWDPPDRNDTALSLWYDDEETIYHFNSMSISSNWSRMAVVMRTSTDSGATWSRARLIIPDHNKAVQVSEPVFGLKGGGIAITHDGGRTLWTSWDRGLTWSNPAGTILGNHPGGLQLDDGRIYGLGRGEDIDGKMPLSISSDGGETFEYSPSEFHPVGGGQRLALLKLREGPLFLASFGHTYGVSTVPMMVECENGQKIQAKELFAAVSFDNGRTWPHKRVVTDGSGRPAECTDGGAVTLSWRSSEHRGYLSVCQSLDGLVHLISSRQHYAFNLEWLRTPQPAPGELVKVKHEVETFDGPGKLDLDDWFDYKSYTAKFTGSGYRIDSIMPYGGLSRVVGAGSFDAAFSFDNFEYHAGKRWREFSFGFKDKLGRTWFLSFGRNRLGLYFKDNPGGNEGGGGKAIEFGEMPRSVKGRFVYNAKTGRCRAFYGFNGAEPEKEMPGSKAGLVLAEPFSESNAAYILMSEGAVDCEHFEIKPLEGIGERRARNAK